LFEWHALGGRRRRSWMSTLRFKGPIPRRLSPRRRDARFRK
jgi:hypothetical protein